MRAVELHHAAGHDPISAAEASPEAFSDPQSALLLVEPGSPLLFPSRPQGQQLGDGPDLPWQFSVSEPRPRGLYPRQSEAASSLPVAWRLLAISS